MKAAAFDYLRPAALDEALAGLAAADGDAKPIAGGCSLGPMLNLRLARPGILVDLRRADGLRVLERLPGKLRIGACWTHADIEDGRVPDVTGGFMRHVARDIAYRAVRNRGTLGGSLAHADPAADWVSTMLALDAELAIRGPGGERREGVGTFMTAAYTTSLAEDEVLVAVEVPVLSETARWGYHKICRKTGEFAQAIGAVVLDAAARRARVVCGAVEAPPLLLPRAADALLAEGAEAAGKAAAEEIEERFAGEGESFRQLHRVAVARAIAAALANGREAA